MYCFILYAFLFLMSRIVVLWDIILDKFTYGFVKRLNPEWPNPLINVEKEEYKLWGAANVANNIASLNDWVALIWILWEDQCWIEVKTLCEQNNITLFSLTSHKEPTITKQRFIENTYKQQLLRVDYEEKFVLQQHHHEEILDALKKISPAYILISDYNKWLIGENLLLKIRAFVEQSHAKILVDAKPWNIDLFVWVFLIKPNFKEFTEIVWHKDMENTDENIEKYWILFVKKYWSNLVITRWAKWASLITTDLDIYHIVPEEDHKVFDVTGAWDTFIATVTYAISIWYTLQDAVKLWNKASWIVVDKVWTAVITKEELF